ncbi:hypothetical protein JCGZ_08700 [Jatropha curcas]|uniref:NAC transcription factor 057 n=1 Tax=Jatropha curcas TaxID=180498 RepID=R4N7R6_JATCU|nr:NAC domain-containing protein 2 [Jatropha curcas]AGL39713.1 NAC transcription factor 057 [Jatropha curcas]KDP36431.1 hypothetical protein JCGZ_08700 [Jatropha curcas]
MEDQYKREVTVTNPENKDNTITDQSHSPSIYHLPSSPTNTDFSSNTSVIDPLINNGNNNNNSTNIIVASVDGDNGGFRVLADNEELYLDSFPAGYRFKPYDRELVVSYLKKKIDNVPLPANRIREVQLYKHNPETLAANYKPHGENEWYFFTPRDRKYPNGDRPNRAAGDGYWKATGADKPIYSGGIKVGFRKALVFYKGKPPRGDKTDWIMHEYRVNEPQKRKRQGNDMKLDDWVLCRIYKKFDKGFRAPARPRGQAPTKETDAYENEHELEHSTMLPIRESKENLLPIVGTYNHEINPYLNTHIANSTLVASHHFNGYVESFDEQYAYGIGPVLGPNLPFQSHSNPSTDYFNYHPLENLDTLGDFSSFDNYDHFPPYQHKNGDNYH